MDDLDEKTGSSPVSPKDESSSTLQPTNDPDHKDSKSELNDGNEATLKPEKLEPVKDGSRRASDDQGAPTKKRKKRPDKPGDKRHKKVSKKAKSAEIAKENYLDTMAEESEGSEADDEDDEDDEELDEEIAEELKEFITDEVVEVEEEEATDVEYEPDKLDEEDLELIAENTGSKWVDDDEEDFKKLRRLKKGTKKTELDAQDEDDLWYEEETSNRALELSDVWATVAECFGQVELVIQILKNERNPQAVQMTEHDSDYDPQEDPDYEKDGDLAQHVEKISISQPAQSSAEDTHTDQNLEQYVDPDELAKEYLTKEDERIRNVDEPERLYVRYAARPRTIDEREIQNEAQWMTRRLLNEFNIDLSKENVRKSYEQTFLGTFKNPHTSVASDVAEKSELVLRWLLNERWEVPFILYHKRHMICPPLTDTIVWRISQLDLEWVRLNTLSEQVQKSIDRIGHEFLPTDILYFSTNFDYLADLNDVNVHLTYHYADAHTQAGRSSAEAKHEPAGGDAENSQEQEMENDYEADDVFGDFEPMENPVHAAQPPSPAPDDADDEEVNELEESFLQESDVTDSEGDDERPDGEADETQEDAEMADSEGEPASKIDSEEDDLFDYKEPEEERDEREEPMDEDQEERETAKEADRKPGARLVFKKNAALHLIETIEREGLDKICTDYVPSANEFYGVLEKSVASTPFAELRVEVRLRPEERPAPSPHMNAIDADVELISGNEDYQIDEFFGKYAAGPYRSGKQVFNALVDYYAKKYSTHISIKRLLREYYKNYCNITCVTTPKGEDQVEVSDAAWHVKRMMGLPVQKMVRTAQVSYEYPQHYADLRDRFNFLNDRRRDLKMVELYLHILKLEREGQVAVTVHPLTKHDEAYWKTDQYAKRFQDFHTLYKAIVNATNSQEPNEYNDYVHQLESEKSLLDKELVVLNGLQERDNKFLTNIVDQMMKAFVKRRVAPNSIWRHFQRAVLERTLLRELVPLFRKEVREQLYNAATTSVLINAQQLLTYKLDVPHTRENVMCMVNDSEAEGLNVYLVVVDERGTIVYLNVYRNLLAAQNAGSSPYANSLHNGTLKHTLDAWTQQVPALAAKYDVGTILVGFVDMHSFNLYYRVDELVSTKLHGNVRLAKSDTQLARLVAAKYINRTREAQAAKGLAPAVAAASQAGQPDHTHYLITAASVCRFHLNFLFELMNLWSEGADENYMLRVKLHPLQEMLPRDRFEHGLKEVLMTEVNRAGIDFETLVDTNSPKKRAYASGVPLAGADALDEYASMKQNVVNYLSLVAGLGVRKAQMLLDRLRTFTPSSRNAMTQLLGPLVFHNAASFIKFSQNSTTDWLDTTRIHPVESGFIAEKLCTGSLDDKLRGEEAIQEIISNPSKLDELDLESYSVLLLEKQDMARMLPYLLFIKRELQAPYSSRRRGTREERHRERERDFHNIDLFYSILNVDRNAFKPGSSVMCKFEPLYQRSGRVLLLPLLLRGHVNDLHHFRSDLQRNHDGPDFESLTGRNTHTRRRNIQRPRGQNRLRAADGKRTLQLQSRSLPLQQPETTPHELVPQRNRKPAARRVPLAAGQVRHQPLETADQHTPQTHTVPEKHQAPGVQNVANPEGGDVPEADRECCICPMSELDRLNLVVKTCNDPFNFATFVIYEKAQRVPGELGKELFLQNEKYNNIDQIIAQFVETLKLNLEEFYTHPKFRHNCELTKVERDLIQESALKPDNITWAIIPPNPKRTHGINHPLRFMLVVIPPGFSVISHEAKSLQDPIYVTHKSFKLWTHEEKTLRDLIVWWKEYGYWHRSLERTKYMQEKQNSYAPKY